MNLQKLFISFNHPEIRNKIAFNFLPADLSTESGYRPLKKSYRDLFHDVLTIIDYFSKEKTNYLPVFKERNETILLVAPNCYEWILTFWATIISGNKLLMLDPNLPAEKIIELSYTMKVKAVVGPSEIIYKCSSLMKAGIQLVSFNDQGRINNQDRINDPGKNIFKVVSFYDIFKNLIIRDFLLTARPDILSKIYNININPESELIYIHTSGTTSNHKFVGLTSDNLCSLLPAVHELIPCNNAVDSLLMVIPLYHVFGLMSAFLVPMWRYIPITILRELSTINIIRAIKETKITLFPAVPAMWNMIYKNILRNLKSQTGTRAKLFKNSIRKIEQGNFSNIGIIDKILFARIRKEIGPSLRVLVSGGAKTNINHIKFFNLLGLQMLEGYGLSETSAITAINTPHHAKLGSVGRPVHPTEVKIVNPDNQGIGEIWIKGPAVFKGYWGKEKLSAENFDPQGFFNSGDIGYLDQDGYLYITGRKKDIIVLPSGKNVYPDELEMIYSNSNFIKEIAILGIDSSLNNSQHYSYNNSSQEERIHAVIFPHYEYLRSFHPDEEVRELIKKELDRLSVGRPSYHKIQEFTITTQELPKTSSKKFIKSAIRKIVIENLSAQNLFNMNNTPVLHNSLERPPVLPLPIDMKNALGEIENYVLKNASQFLPPENKNLNRKNLKKMHLENDLGLDSIQRSEIFFSIANKLKIKLPTEKLAYITTLEELINLIISIKSININSKLNIDDHLVEKAADLSATTEFSLLMAAPFDDLSLKATSKRLNLIANKVTSPNYDSSTELAPLSNSLSNFPGLKGHIENYIGDTLIPTGVAGPIRVHGDFAQGSFYIPLATSEGALVASIHRGAMVINAAGGAKVKVLNHQIIRSPSFLLNDLNQASNFSQWIDNNYQSIKLVAESTSKHLQLKNIEKFQYGRRVTLRFLYDSGNAAGQNMCTIATEKTCLFITEHFQNKNNYNEIKYVLDNNLSGDKKVNMLNLTSTRGHRVTAEVLVPKVVIQNYFHTTALEICEISKEGLIGTILSSGVGINAHYANMIAAIFIATGQDVASTHESAVGFTHFEKIGDDLLTTVLLPTLVVGTVGGGTGLPSQATNLKIMECFQEPVNKFAEIVAVAVLAGELSIVASHAAGDFTRAHAVYGR